jgi:hypothetical protein
MEGIKIACYSEEIKCCSTFRSHGHTQLAQVPRYLRAHSQRGSVIQERLLLDVSAAGELMMGSKFEDITSKFQQHGSAAR